MIVYTVHEPEPHAQSIEERADNVVFVKEGFTWWGFFLNALWLPFQGLWLSFLQSIFFLLLLALSSLASYSLAFKGLHKGYCV